MTKFIYLYRGSTPSSPDVTAEQGADRMAAFGAWMQRVGAALVDAGSPFGVSGSIRDDGKRGPAGDLVGYSIVEAEDLDAARALTEGLPFLAGNTGRCAVEVFELLPL